VFGVLFAIGGYVMLTTSQEPPFQNNPIFATIVVIGIVGLPLVISLASSYLPTASMLGLDSDASRGNYQDSMERLVRGRQRRPMNRTELNIWLFMRISGFLLIFLALFHFFIMHFVYGVDTIDFNFVVARW